jgi:hypothetical protein
VPVIDLHTKSIELCEQLGKEGCKSFSPLKEVDGTNTVDNTHLNAEGSSLFAKVVVAEIRKSIPELAACLRDQPKPSSTAAAKGDESEAGANQYAAGHKAGGASQ